MKKPILALLAAATAVTGLSACTSEADRANENLSKAAENFEVPRRITGINGITDKVIFTVEGFCSLESNGRQLDAICKTPEGEIERTSLGLSDNVTYLSTQIGGVDVDLFRPRVIFRPENVIPNFDLSTSGGR